MNFGKIRTLIFSIILIFSFCHSQTQKRKGNNHNLAIEGWYADPEGAIFNNKYWIYPTYSAPFNKQVFIDTFSSNDLVNWMKYDRVIDTTAIKWAQKAMWSPAIVKKDGYYFLFFAANDIQSDKEKGGIGIGIARNPESTILCGVKVTGLALITVLPMQLLTRLWDHLNV